MEAGQLEKKTEFKTIIIIYPKQIKDKFRRHYVMNSSHSPSPHQANHRKVENFPRELRSREPASN